MNKSTDLLAVLPELNARVVAAESGGARVQGPGLPSFITDATSYITQDCITP
jgi:hypothetical protein